MMVGISFPLSHYFSLLPYESYHMTTNSIHSKMTATNEKWREFIISHLDLFEQISQTIGHERFSPKINLSCCQCHGCIRLVVNLPLDQSNIIEDVAKKFNIRSGHIFQMCGTSPWDTSTDLSRMIYLPISRLLF